MRVKVDSEQHLRELLDADRNGDHEIQVTGSCKGGWVLLRISISPDSEGDGVGTYDITNEKSGGYKTLRSFLRRTGVGAHILLGCVFHDDGKR